MATCSILIDEEITENDAEEIMKLEITSPNQLSPHKTLYNLVHRFIHTIKERYDKPCKHPHSTCSMKCFPEMIEKILKSFSICLNSDQIYIYNEDTTFNIEDFSTAQSKLYTMTLIDIEYRYVKRIKENVEGKLWIKSNFHTLHDWKGIDVSNFNDQFVLYNRYLKIIQNNDIDDKYINDELDKLCNGQFDDTIEPAVIKMIAMFNFIRSTKQFQKSCNILDIFDEIYLKWPSKNGISFGKCHKETEMRRDGTISNLIKNKTTIDNDSSSDNKFPKYMLPFLKFLGFSVISVKDGFYSDLANYGIYVYFNDYETKLKDERLRVYNKLYQSLEKGERSCLCSFHHIFDPAINKHKMKEQHQKVVSKNIKTVHLTKKKRFDPFSYIFNNNDNITRIPKDPDVANTTYSDVVKRSQTMTSKTTIVSMEKTPQPKKIEIISFSKMPKINYHPRVSRWFKLKWNDTIPFENYHQKPILYQSKMIFLHNFLHNIDNLIHDKRYAHRFDGKEQKRFLIVKYQHFELDINPNIGFIEYCFNENQICYHRFINKCTPTEMFDLVLTYDFSNKDLSFSNIIKSDLSEDTENQMTVESIEMENCEINVDQVFDTVTFKGKNTIITVFPRN